MPAPTQEMIALARERYQAGDPVAKILGETGMSIYTLYVWLKGGPDDGEGPRLPRIPLRRVIVGKRRKLDARDRMSLVVRLWRTAERQVCDIEERLRQNTQQPDERDRDARVLATMVKTLRELRALHEAEEELSGEDEGPANLDDFRRDLARQIDGIIARRKPQADREAKG